MWSCRLEEPMKYGDFLRMVPKNREAIPDNGGGAVAETEKIKKEMENEYSEKQENLSMW